MASDRRVTGGERQELVIISKKRQRKEADELS